MDSLDFEVTEAFAITMSKGMLPSLSKLKRNRHGKKNSTASTTSTISQVSMASNNNDPFDSFCTTSPRGSIWDAKIQATEHNTMRLGFDVLA
ncbi:unnamed protein product [Orchesella dallaii]|uniref:Uncharacterized protein n=1 Tax=Orchesella dallaii TaxID=48710 RepID=A0ABP1SB54_9HEXA